jgi:hypothetical protein
MKDNSEAVGEEWLEGMRDKQLSSVYHGFRSRFKKSYRVKAYWWIYRLS